MAWNEPGGSGGKDPWGRRNGEQGPPDLDEVLRKLQDRLSALFGGRGGGGSSRSGRGGSFGIGLIVLVLVAIWALSGIYIVDEGRQGVVLQFGDFKKITNPGPHWYPRFIQSVEVVNVAQSRSVTIGTTAEESLMLTQDENIVDVQYTVQYKVKDPKDFLFNVRGPDTTLRQAAESAMREVVGKNRMDFVITVGRDDVAAKAKQLAQHILDRYNTGLLITELNMQQAQPPQQVQEAFLDAIKAREDEQRLKNNAEAYKNDILPKARGKAARMLEEAQAYRSEVVARAEGDTSRFLAVLSEYQKAPAVTRDRLYLETMQSVLERSPKVMLDADQGNSLMYLPLDKLLQGGAKRATSLPPEAAADSDTPASSTTSSDTSRFRDRLRGREMSR